MGFRDYIARMIAPGLMPESQVRELVAEEVKRARQALPVYADYDPLGEGFRRYSMGGSQVRRDLTPGSQDVMIEIAYFLHATSGMAKRFVADTKNFVIGGGVTFTVKNDRPDKAAAQALEDFWGDSVNNMDRLLGPRIEFLGILGEQCWPVTVNPYNGFVQVSYVDPSNIDDVIVMPGFPEIPNLVQLRGVDRDRRELRVIRASRDPLAREYGKRVGDCFYWAVNKPPNSPRGWSDLLQTADFITQLEETLFSELDRIQLMKCFVWDVLLQGADPKTIKEFRENNPPPKPGALKVHNEKVTWTAVAPDLKQHDTKTFFDLMKGYVSGVHSRPDSWFGSGGKAYQTEADLMGEPAFRCFEERQEFVKGMLEEMAMFVLDQAILHRALPGPAQGQAYKVVANMPPMRRRDLQAASTTLKTTTESLIAAESQGYARKETCVRIWASVATEVGFEVDVEAEVTAAKEHEEIPVDYRKVPAPKDAPMPEEESGRDKPGGKNP